LVTAVFYLLALRPRLRAARWTTAIAYAGMILTFVSATKLTTAANAIFLQYTGPAYVLVLAPFLLKERFRSLDAACVAASLCGMALFFVGKVEAGQLTGNVLGACSGVFFAFTILLIRHDAAAGGDAIPSMTLGNILAAAVALPLCAPELAHLTPAGALPLLYLGIVQMGFAYILFGKGMRRVPAAEASLLAMLEPLFNPVWVFLGTGERPGAFAILGGGVVIGAVAVRTVLAQRSPAQAITRE
jgi:drug/metabolite transporter (DMT)-like permease